MTSLDRHIHALETKRSELKEEIEAERERPLPDQVKILELKRRRVHMKDEVAQLKLAS